MKTPIYRIALMIGTLFSFGCGNDISNDRADAPTAVAARPELIIGEVDARNRSLAITISNPTDTAMFVPGSGDQTVYGAYWFVGDEVFDVPECGTGFWDNAITIAPGAKERLSVWLPQSQAELPSKMTLAIVYGGHGEITREELPKISENDPRINLIRHPDALMGCRKIEAEVTLAGKIGAAQGDEGGGPVPGSRFKIGTAELNVPCIQLSISKTIIERDGDSLH